MIKINLRTDYNDIFTWVKWEIQFFKPLKIKPDNFSRIVEWILSIIHV